MNVRYHPEARKEQRTLPMREQAAIANVIEKLQVLGDRLPFPHSSGIQGTQLRALRPRSGRSPWRPIYRRLGDQMVILSIAPEAEKDPRGYARAVTAAEQRLADLLNEMDKEDELED